MNFNLRFYWSLMMRRMPVMLALLMLCSVAAVILALKLPPTYSTTARLLVEAPSISSDSRSSAQSDPAEQLQVIQQRLMTRSNLLDIAHKFVVFTDINAMTPDRVIDKMTAATRIRLQSGRDQATLMSISFEGRSPQVAANVVNEYTTLILDSSTKSRRDRVENTVSFYQQQVKRLSDDLDQQSAKIVSFKNANANALPDDLEYRMNRQSLLQERLSRLEQDRASLITQRSDVVTVFQATGQVQNQGKALTPDEQRLQALRADLDQAKAVYSENNPKVKLLQSRIAQLEASVTAGASSNSAEPASLLDVTLAGIDARVSAMDKEITATNGELASLQDSISKTSSNAIALEGLQRDYDNMQSSYNGAVANLNQANVNERIESAAQGQRVAVIEGAAVPQDPSGPNRRKIIVLGVGMGFALAGGWFLLLEFLNRSIRRPAELQSRFGIMPIAAIPYIESRGERRMRRGLLISASLAVLVGVPAALWYIDSYYMPLDLLADKVITRLNLS